MSELPPAAEVADALKFVVAPSGGAAAGAFGGFCLASWLVARKYDLRWRVAAPTLSVVGLAAGLAVGSWAMGDDRPFPWVPDKPWHFGWWAIGLMLTVELIARFTGVAVGHLLRGTAAGVVAAFVVPAWTQTEARWWVPAVALAIAGTWAVVDAVGRRSPGGSVPAAVAVACGAGAAVCLHAESVGFLNTATFLFTGLAVIAVICWATGADGSPAGSAAVGPLLVLMVLTRHLRDSQVPTASFLLAGLSPLALGLVLLPGVRRLDRWPWGTALKILAVLIPAAVGVLVAMEAAPYTFGPKQEEG